jgi:hypothetical protein
VQATGSGPLTYQWFRNGVALAGATTASLVFSAVSAADAGTYHVTVTGPGGSVTSLPVTLAVGTGRLTALSIRSIAGRDAETLITGASVSGTGTKNLVMRAVGPTLAETQYGSLVNGLPDPQLRLFDAASQQIAFNEDWGGGAGLMNEFALVGLAPLPPASRDAAFAPTVTPANYTTHVTAGAGAGLVLMEIYDRDDGTSPARLSALSARSVVGMGADILILGFVISGDGPLTVVIRGLGPALAPYVGAAALGDPRLAVFSGPLLAGTNDDWGGTTQLANAFTAVGLTPLPAGSRDAALLLTLPPGTYTAHLSGADGGTGVGLIEIYEIR